MQKRAGLARAMALSPEVLLFDEPSAGLDPISSRLLDDLILELRDSLGATIVMVTHELASIFAVGNNSVFLDAETKTQIALGDPKRLLAECPDPRCNNFSDEASRLTRKAPELTGGLSVSRRANPKLVGGFVLAAIGLAVAAALVLAASRCSSRRVNSSSFSGNRRRPCARLASPVPRGSGRQGRGHRDPLRPQRQQFRNPGHHRNPTGVIAKYSPPAATLSAEGVKRLIDEGLRARLETSSLVTGSAGGPAQFLPRHPGRARSRRISPITSCRRYPRRHSS